MFNKSLIAALIFAQPFASNAARAADVKMLCASGMREIVSELQPRIGQVVGRQVSVSFGEAGDLRTRISLSMPLLPLASQMSIRTRSGR